MLEGKQGTQNVVEDDEENMDTEENVPSEEVNIEEALDTDVPQAEEESAEKQEEE